jgi:ribonuclease HI
LAKGLFGSDGQQDKHDRHVAGRPLVHMYTDGGCAPNPGPGGWAAILLSDDQRKGRRELSGAQRDTTNNRMELTAAIEGLKALKVDCNVVIFTDSRYLRDAFEAGWIANWQRNGWRTKDRKPVQNIDLWQELIALCQRHAVVWQWVRGHAETAENLRADELVARARSGLRS